MSEERIADLEAAVVSLHERMATAEAALVKMHQSLDAMVALIDSLHRRLSAIRDAMGPQPPLSTGNRRNKKWHLRQKQTLPIV